MASFFYIYMWIEISLSNHDYRKKVDVAKREMKKIKEYAERGYTHAVALDLSKYFDTLNHEKLLNLLRRDIKDERVIQWIKRYLKSGVMENGEGPRSGVSDKRNCRAASPFAASPAMVNPNVSQSSRQRRPSRMMASSSAMNNLYIVHPS